MCEDDGAAYVHVSRTAEQSCSVGSQKWLADVDGTVTADVQVYSGRLKSISPTGTLQAAGVAVDIRQSMMFPTFVDVHTHIGNSHTMQWRMW